MEISNPVPSESYATLCLSRNGDALELKGPRLWESGKAVLLQTVDTCKTHQQVLRFLQKLASSEECNLVSYCHRNNTDYVHHVGTWPKGAAHPCSLEQQISFVQLKILEHEHGTRSPKQTWGQWLISKALPLRS